jgi:hypothetical protein
MQAKEYWIFTTSPAKSIFYIPFRNEDPVMSGIKKKANPRTNSLYIKVSTSRRGEEYRYRPYD